MSRRVRTAVLISGRGSNMRSLVGAARASGYPAEIVLVISNNPDAGGLDFAREQGIEAFAINHRHFADRTHFDAAVDAALKERDIGLVACAGFMRILGGAFVDTWHGRLLNIHPSLLPAYRGLNTHERALADGVRQHGCTVHFMVSELDAGPIIAQARVEVLEDDTPDTLAARVLEQEHRVYPAALSAVASGAVRLEGDVAAGVDQAQELACFRAK